MSRMRERIPKENFQAVFRPMIREFGSRTVILRINESARTAIPRQTKLAQLMPKLEILVYDRARPAVDEELERLWNIYFEQNLGEGEDAFDELSEKLNKSLEQDKLPEDEERLKSLGEAVDGISELLKGQEFEEIEIDAVFAIKAFPEVFEFYKKRKVEPAPEASS